MKKPRNRMQTNRNTRAEEPDKEPAKPIPVSTWRGDAVDFGATYCPNCGSARNYVTRTVEPILSGAAAIQQRTHVCKNCHVAFGSVADIPRVDIPSINKPGQK